MVRFWAPALCVAVVACGRAEAQYVKPTLGGAVRYVLEQDVAVPQAMFPGATVANTNAAWLSGKQPENLQYWPQTAYGTPKRLMLPCVKTYVLQDTAAGWGGLCKNLMQHKTIRTLEGCKSFCWLEPRCAVWQFVNQTNPGQCWVGYGTHCSKAWGRKDGIVVEGAQRLQHGNVKVLALLQGVKIKNLWNLPLAVIDPAQGENLCKLWCYSDIACQYWQYNPREGGCWLEARMFSTNNGMNQANVVAYPLSLDHGAEMNANWQIGEYIAHFCPPDVAPATAAPTAAPPSQPSILPPVVQPSVPPVQTDDGGTLPWAWIASAVAVVLGCAGTAWYLMQQQQGEQKGGKGRSSSGSRRNQQQREEYEQSFKSAYENDPLMQDLTGSATSEGGRYDYDGQPRGGAVPMSSRSSSRSHQPGQQQNYSARTHSSAPYQGPQGQNIQGPQGQNRAGGYGQVGAGQPGNNVGGGGQGGQGNQAGGGYGQAGQSFGGNNGQGTMIPPPTQLVDFGQNPGRMAPTQLFQNQGAGAGVGGMAPTQLLNQGMPFPSPTPSPTPGYPSPPPGYPRPMQGMM